MKTVKKETDATINQLRSDLNRVMSENSGLRATITEERATIHQLQCQNDAYEHVCSTIEDLVDDSSIITGVRKLVHRVTAADAEIAKCHKRLTGLTNVVAMIGQQF